MNPTFHISQMISTIALAVVLASSPIVTQAMPPSSFLTAQGKPLAHAGVRHARQADYGLLGNAVKFVFDKYVFERVQVEPASEFFEQPDTSTDTESGDEGGSLRFSDTESVPSAPTLDTPSRLGPQPDFGLLGNAIKKLVDMYSGHNQIRTSKAAVDANSDSHKPSTVKAAAATPSQDVPMAEGSWAQKRQEKRQQRREQRDYGLLGNVVARLVSEFSGSSEAAGDSSSVISGSSWRPGSRAKASKAVPVPAAPKADSVSSRVEGLKAVRDLVQLLGSSFLEDPAFKKAAEAFKQLDARTSIDSPVGEGGFITAAERERLLSLAQAMGCTVCSADA